MEKAQISGWQFYLLTFIQLLGTTFFLRPQGIIAVAKQDAWMIWLWTGAAGIVLALLWLKLAEQYPGLSLVQICMKAGGKWVGGAIAFCYVVFFVQLAAWVVRNLGDFMKSTFMHRTPISVFHIMILIIVCYASIKGVETIARSNEILIPIIKLTFVLMFVFMLPIWDSERLQPAFRLDLWTTVKETRNIIGFPYMESVVLLMVVPYVRNRQKKGFVWGIISSTLLLICITVFLVACLGVTRASHETYPLFILVQDIRIGPLIENLEASVTVILLAAIFLKITITFHGAVSGICQLFRLRDRTWVAVPLAVIVAGLALSNENVVENIEWDRRYLFEYELLYGLIFPLILLAVTWIRKRTHRG
jgi:spore germination protein (amino acid permease)